MTDRRAQIEARLAAATPWPWVATYEESDEWTSITGQGGPLDGGGWVVCPEVATCEGEHGADSDLIAQTPADLRWLLDALAEAEAERDALAATVRRVRALADEWEFADKGYTGEEAHYARWHGERIRAALAASGAPDVPGHPDAPHGPGDGESEAVEGANEVVDLLAALQRSIEEAKARRIARYEVTTHIDAEDPVDTDQIITPSLSDPGWRDVQHDTKTLACMDGEHTDCTLPDHCRCTCHTRQKDR